MSALTLTFLFGLIGGLTALVIIQASRMMPYVYCGAKVSAWEARLLSEARLLEFADSPKVTNILAGLDETDYRPHLAEIPRVENVDVATVERALKMALSESYRELLKMVPKERRETVSKIIQRVDLWNLKVLLTAIHNKVPKEKRVEEMIPSPTMPRERLELLASAESFDELLEYFKGTDYFDVLSKALEDYEELGLIALLSAMDEHYYSSLWADVLERKAQRPVLKAVVGYEIDAVNIKLILRLKKEGVPPDEIRKYTILPSYELREDLLRGMAIADDIRSAVNLIQRTTYGPILMGALPQVEATGSLFAAEKALDEGLLKVGRWMAIVRPFSLAPVLAYIHLKDAEVRNLRAAVRLKADKVEPEKIKEMFVKVPKIEL